MALMGEAIKNTLVRYTTDTETVNNSEVGNLLSTKDQISDLQIVSLPRPVMAAPAFKCYILFLFLTILFMTKPSV